MMIEKKEQISEFSFIQKYPFFKPPDTLTYTQILETDHDLKTKIVDKINKKQSRGISERTEKIILTLLKEKEKDPFLKNVWHEIRRSGINAMRAGGINKIISWIGWKLFENKMTKMAKKGKTIFEIETELRKMVDKRIDKSKTKIPNLRRRAERSYSYISKYIQGDIILDYGAGDCLLAEKILLETGKRVVACDIIDYKLTEKVEFFLCDQRESNLKGKLLEKGLEKVDTSILYTVLHHSENPFEILKNIKEITTKRIIIMEGYVDTPFHYVFNVFFDWFLNRVVKSEDVPVPTNYLSTDAWKEVFKNLGLELVYSSSPKITEKVAPEYHKLYVLDVK